MLFLNKRFLILVFIFCCSTFCFAIENPFNITIDIDKRNTSEGIMQLIKVGISSRSGEDSNYILKLNIPEANMKIMDGKKLYTGTLGPLKSDEFYITVKGVSDGAGEIIARVYVSLDGNSVDTSTTKEFVSKYAVKKVGEDFDISVTRAEERQNIVKPEVQAQQQQQQTPAAPITIDQMKDAAQGIDDTDMSQKFRINSGNRYNGALRGILFILCFIVIGGLLYMSMRKKR